MLRWRGDATRVGRARRREHAVDLRPARARLPRGVRGAGAARRPARAPAAARRAASWSSRRPGREAAQLSREQELPAVRATLSPWPRARTEDDAQPGPDLGDHPGRRQARLRLLLRAPPPDRPPARGTKATPRTPTARTAAQHLREMFDELGPTFVKFGQLLSTRPDVLPPDIIAELRRLQDDVTPFRYEQVEQVVQARARPADRAALPRVLRAPVAAASIGQVHGRVLPNGRRVAVKVQRPNAPGQIEADLSLLYQAADREGPRPRARLHRRARLSSTSSRARSARSSTTATRRATRRRFRHNFAGHPHVRVPQGDLELHPRPRAHARVPRRHPVGRTSTR